MPLGYHSKLKIEGVASFWKLVVDYQSLEIFKLGFWDPNFEIINYFDKESLFMNWRFVQYQAGLGIRVQNMKQVYALY
jgi:hypothetical protein